MMLPSTGVKKNATQAGLGAKGNQEAQLQSHKQEDATADA